MSYYRTMNQVNKEIAEILKKVAEGMSVSVDLLIITLTEKYEIGEKYVRNRIDLKVEASKMTGTEIEIDIAGVLKKCQA